MPASGCRWHDASCFGDIGRDAVEHILHLLTRVTGKPFLTGGPMTYSILAQLPTTVFPAANYQRTRPAGYTEDYWSMRFDVRATNKDNISFRYLSQKGVSQNATARSIASGYSADVPASSKNYGGTWTRSLSSKLINDLRINYQRIGVEFGSAYDARAPGCTPRPADLDKALASISFSPALGLTKTAAMPTIGVPSGFPQGRVGKVYQYADNLTWSPASTQLLLDMNIRI